MFLYFSEEGISAFRYHVRIQSPPRLSEHTVFSQHLGMLHFYLFIINQFQPVKALTLFYKCCQL